MASSPHGPVCGLSDGAADRDLAAPLHPVQGSRAHQPPGGACRPRAYGHLAALRTAVHVGLHARAARGLRSSKDRWRGTLSRLGADRPAAGPPDDRCRRGPFIRPLLE
jgi:hypothetical protein